MPRQVKRLAPLFVKGSLAPGVYNDGDGLRLIVDASGSKRWSFRFRWQGREPEMGLGSYPAVSLANARDAVAAARREIAAGRNPIDLRREARGAANSGVTFGEVADETVASLTKGFRNQKHRQQWTNTLATYAPALRSRPAHEIDTADVLAVLQPIWTVKPETASRVRGRIERILDGAKAKADKGDVRWHGWTNPARWRGHLDTLLPKRAKLTRGHHAALPYADVPAFYADLRKRQALAALALRFTIVTVSRSNETYGARWNEIDRQAKVWNVPPERMKAGRPHRVPLTDEALAILDAAQVAFAAENERKAGDYIFPGAPSRKTGEAKPLSGEAMSAVLDRMKIDVTVHGFRSSFRDWAGDETHFPREIAEQALAHVVGDETEQAYRRGDALTRRRALMTAWSDYVTSANTGTNVVSLKTA